MVNRSNPVGRKPWWGDNMLNLFVQIFTILTTLYEDLKAYTSMKSWMKSSPCVGIVVGSESTLHIAHLLSKQPGELSLGGKHCLNLELLNYDTLAEKRRERKGTWTHQPLPSLVLHAPSKGQPASQAQTDTTVVLDAPSSGLRLEREGGLNHYHWPQNSSSFERLWFLYLETAQKIIYCTKSVFQSSEIKHFVVAQFGEVILFLQILWLLIYSRQGQKIFTRHVPLCRSGDAEHRPKGDGRPTDLHFNSLWICSQLLPPTHFNVVHDSTPLLTGTRTHASCSPDEMLTTRPPSPWSQYLISLYMLMCWFSQWISANHFITGFFVFLEYKINLFPVLHTLYSASANQSLATLQVQVISQSEFSDVTLGSSGMFSIIHGSCFNTLSLFIHSVRILHLLLAHRVDDILQRLPQLFITEFSNHFVRSWERRVE